MTQPEDELLAAGRELSGAVRDMARAVRRHEVPAETLRRLAGEMSVLTSHLGGDIRPAYWETPSDAPVVGGRQFRHHSPFGGDLNLLAADMHWEEVAGPEGQPGLVARISVDELHTGPPDSVHGGFVAGLFDEILGATQGRATGGPGVTGKLIVWYRARTPLHTELELAGWIESERGRRILARATCRAGQTLTAEAQGLFVRPRGGVF